MTRRHLLACLVLLLQASITLAAEPFTIVVLPDTQEYVDRRSPRFKAREGVEDWTPYFFKQIEWIKQSRQKLNTVFVVQEGDLTQTDYEPEGQIAHQAMTQLDGVVPYCICIGNHDIGAAWREPEGKRPGRWSTANTRDSLFDKYFPKSKFASQPWFGGSMDHTCSNAWYRFEQAGMKFMIVSIEFKPRDEVLAWANKVVADHPDHRAIILTHAYMGLPTAKDPRLMDKSFASFPVAGNTGQQIFDKLVSQHRNIFMVLCGHVGGQHVRIVHGKHGNVIFEVLSDFQAEPQGGASNLIYLTFDPDKDTINGYTYNPAKNEYREGPHSRFTFEYPMLKAKR